MDLEERAAEIGKARAGEPHQQNSEVFSRRQVVAVLTAGILGSLVVILQPVLLGPMAAEGRISLREIGQAATLETLGMAIALAMGGMFFKARRLKLIVLAAAIVSVAANLITMVGRHETILLARLTNGLSMGVVLWVWMGLATRVALPSRLVAIFVTLQSACALALSSFFSGVVMPRIGAPGGYACLAAASLVVAATAIGIPNEYRERAGEGARAFLPPSTRGFVGLLAVSLQLAAIMVLWVYVLPLGHQKGLSESTVSITVSISLAAQIAGGLCGVVLARLNARTVLYGSLAASLLTVALIALSSGPATFVCGFAAINFFWLFAPCFQMPFLLEVDPSGHAGMQMSTAQMLGLSAGPALASFAVRGADSAPVFIVSVVLCLGAGALVFAANAPAPRTSPRDRTLGQGG